MCMYASHHVCACRIMSANECHAMVVTNHTPSSPLSPNGVSHASSPQASNGVSHTMGIECVRTSSHQLSAIMPLTRRSLSVINDRSPSLCSPFLLCMHGEGSSEPTQKSKRPLVFPSSSRIVRANRLVSIDRQAAQIIQSSTNLLRPSSLPLFYLPFLLLSPYGF